MNTTTGTRPTAAQQAVIDATARRVVVIAGPGSGKTKTLVDRILADQQRGKRPDHMAAITFTQNAAKELRERLAAAGAADLAYVGTLHGFCLDYLRAVMGVPVVVLDADGAEMLLKSVLDELRSKASMDKAREAIAGLGPAPDEKLKLVVQTYRKRLHSNGAVDYDTILTLTRDYLKAGNQWKAWDAIYVDEYQDSGPLDAAIYDLLNCAFRFIVGDPDQAIYGFRGARMENLLDVAGSADTWVGFMEGNFRSCPAVCRAATNLARHNRNRLDKATVAVTGRAGAVRLLDGAPFPTEQAELVALTNAVKQIPLGESTAVLVRYNTTRQAVIDQLKGSGVAVKERPESETKEWKATKLTISLLCNPANNLTLFFWLAGRWGRESASAMMAQHRAGKAVSLGFPLLPYATTADLARILSQAGHDKECVLRAVDAAETIGTVNPAKLAIALHEGAGRQPDVSADGVSVLTMHGAKGLEFDNVFVPACELESLPGASADLVTTEEARRLFYVAITRARHLVALSYALTRQNAYTSKRENRNVSPFIAEL